MGSACWLRLPMLYAAAACALLAAAGRPAYAGLFGHDSQPPQWGLDAAKTPVPDYAKGARAVILYDEVVDTVDEQGRAVERRRWVTRILAPQGRDDAYCAVLYDVDEKINYFHEWTIGADEKQFQAKDTDFADVGDPGLPQMLSTEKARVVRSPAADPGATIICESEEVLAPYLQEGIWEIQDDIPAVLRAIEIDLPPGRPYSVAWHRHDPVTPTEVAPNHWRWEIKDAHALDLSDVRSSLDEAALDARLSIQWGGAAVEGTDKQWQALGAEWTELEAHRADSTPQITAKAQELVAGAPDFYTKLKDITEYIQKNIQYFIVERGIGGWQAHYAGDIYRNGYGDCKDKTTLLIAMLQAVGIQAFYVPVDDRRGVVDPQAPSLAGNHMITAIEIPPGVNDPRLIAVVKANDGKRYLIFDPTNERTPVGNLPSYEQGSYGLLAAGDASQVIALPVLPPDANGMDRTGSFTLSPDGALSGTVDTSRSGPEGADLRNFLKDTSEIERRATLERTVGRDLPGVVLDSFHFVEPADLDKPLELDYKVTVPQYAHAAGPLLLVRPRVVGDDALPFDDKPRTLPIDMEATGDWRDSFDITLPAGYAVDGTPDPVNVDVGFASYHSTVTAKGSVLHYEREYVVKEVEIPPSKAADFRMLEGSILEDEKGAVVLKKD
ncbi:MAG TPA: transglutaminase domain-containing protein [Terracidiphilus sp.]|nr:transglutaminase domain-containing protein [Terracidiphilus sp.]